jgi:hypothetical protein
LRHKLDGEKLKIETKKEGVYGEKTVDCSGIDFSVSNVCDCRMLPASGKASKKTRLAKNT